MVARGGIVAGSRGGGAVIKKDETQRLTRLADGGDTG